MRRAVLVLIGTVIGLVLLLGFKTAPRGQASRPVALAPATHGSTGSSQQPKKQPASPKGPTKSPTKSATPGHTSHAPAQSSGPRTVSGTTINTPYGPVQVRATVQNGKLTDVTPLQLPNDNPTSQQIASYAAPTLRSEALNAGSAHINIVSGATYTSEGYAQSLQSALDSRHG